eukprot:scaffold15313_cov132-Isochrysis_galbana.AAC.6
MSLMCGGSAGVRRESGVRVTDWDGGCTRIELPGRVVQILRCSTDVALWYGGKMSSLKDVPTALFG